jgi:hypothetical protein
MATLIVVLYFSIIYRKPFLCITFPFGGSDKYCPHLVDGLTNLKKKTQYTYYGYGKSESETSVADPDPGSGAFLTPLKSFKKGKASTGTYLLEVWKHKNDQQDSVWPVYVREPVHNQGSKSYKIVNKRKIPEIQLSIQ